MCSKSSCSSCSKLNGCGWCASSNAVTPGDCILTSEAGQGCSAIITEADQCPDAPGDLILKNLTGIVGAMIGVAILLNVYNRLSNRRRRNKLQRSIFQLRTYVYTASARKRAKTARHVHRQAQGEQAVSSDPTQNVEVVGSAPTASASSASSRSLSSSVDGDDVSFVTCTVCLCAFEEEEVIKVLPCGHEFHSGCLDSWLEQKATCPLCTAPAFTSSRDQDQTSDGRAPIHGPQQADAAPPLFRSSDQVQSSQLGGAGSGDAVGHGRLLLARPASPSPPPPESAGEAGFDEARPRETARKEEEEGATVPAMATAMVFEEETGVQKDGLVWEETASITSAGDDRPLTGGAARASSHVQVGDGTSGADGVADGGGGERPAGATYQSGKYSPYHGGGNTTEAARPRVTPAGADREVSLTELEKGQAKPAKDGADVGVDAVDAIGVVVDGDLSVGHGESGVADGGGVDIEGGRGGVDGSVNEIADALQA